MTLDSAPEGYPQTPTPWRGFVLIGGAGAMAWALNFWTFAILARALGPERFGLLNFGLSVAAVLGAFLAPNLNVWGARLIAADHGAVSRTILLVNGVQTLGGLILFAVLLIAYPLVLSHDMAMQLISCNLMFFTASLGTQWVAQGLQRLDLIAWNQVIAASCSLLVTLAISRGHGAEIRAPIALVSGPVLASAFIIWRLWRSGSLASDKIHWRAELPRLKHAAVFGYFSIFGVANQYAGVIWIKLFGNAQDVAFYGIASRTYLTFILVTAMLSTVFFPRVARLKPAGNAAVRAEIGIWVTVALTLGCAPAALMVGDPASVIHVLFSDSYSGGTFAIRASGVAILFAFANNAYSMSLLALGHDHVFMRGQLASVFVALVGGAAATFAFGLRGGSITLALIDLAMLASLLPAFQRNIGDVFWRYWMHPLAAMALTIAVMALPVLRDQPFLRLTLGAVVYGLAAMPWRRVLSWRSDLVGIS